MIFYFNMNDKPKIKGDTLYQEYINDDIICNFFYNNGCMTRVEIHNYSREKGGFTHYYGLPDEFYFDDETGEWAEPKTNKGRLMKVIYLGENQ